MAPPLLIAAVAMAPDASWAITVSADGTVQTWGTGAPNRVIHWAVPIDGSQPVTVARAGDRIRVLWADGKTIRLHENVRGAWARDAECGAPAAVEALAMSPAGVLAAVACADGTLRTMNAGTGEFGPELATSGRIAQAVAVASDVGPVVAVFGDGSVRRYDPTSGTSDMMGAGPGIDLVAVTPDGETVIAAKTEGVLSRLDLSGTGLAGDSAPATGRFRMLGTAITTIAVDGTGRRVLASRPDGTLWLHDMTGGPATELHVPEASPEPDPPDQRWWESAAMLPAPGTRTPTVQADDDTEIWSVPPASPAPDEAEEKSVAATATYAAEVPVAEVPPAPRPAPQPAPRRGPWWRRWRRS
jgi:WD40 repeat protein